MKVRFSVALLVHPLCIDAEMQSRVGRGLTRRFSVDMRRVKKRSIEGAAGSTVGYSRHHNAAH